MFRSFFHFSIEYRVFKTRTRCSGYHIIHPSLLMAYFSMVCPSEPQRCVFILVYKPIPLTPDTPQRVCCTYPLMEPCKSLLESSH